MEFEICDGRDIHAPVHDWQQGQPDNPLDADRDDDAADPDRAVHIPEQEDG